MTSPTKEIPGRQRFLPIPDDEACLWDDPTGYYWVGSPACEDQTEEEKVIIKARAAGKLWFLGGISDPDPSCDYHEYAIVKSGRVSYLLHTSGCSCPSPTETWCVVGSANSTRHLIQSALNDEGHPDWFLAWAKGRAK